MTRKMTKPTFPYALASSTLGTVLVSLTAVWLATASYAPVAAPDAPSAHFDQFTAALPPVARPRRRRLDLLAQSPLPRSPLP